MVVPGSRRSVLLGHGTGGARGARAGLVGADGLRDRGPALRGGAGAAGRPPAGPGQREVAGAQRRAGRAVRPVVVPHAPEPRGRRPPSPAAAARARVRAAARHAARSALPRPGHRAGGRVRRRGPLRVHVAVRGAVRIAGRDDGPGAARPGGRAVRGVVDGPRTRARGAHRARPAARRGGAGGAVRLRRRARGGPARAACRRRGDPPVGGARRRGAARVDRPAGLRGHRHDPQSARAGDGDVPRAPGAVGAARRRARTSVVPRSTR